MPVECQPYRAREINKGVGFCNLKVCLVLSLSFQLRPVCELDIIKLMNRYHYEKYSGSNI